MLNRKIVLMFISLVFLCLLSTSIACAADNITSSSDSGIDEISSDINGALSDVDNTDMDDDDDNKIKRDPNAGSINDLNKEILEKKGSINLTRNYGFDFMSDLRYASFGIVLNNTNLTIEGNNHSVDMEGMGRLFTATNSTIKINNLNIKNTNLNAIWITSSDLTTSHVIFDNDNESEANAVLAFGSNYTSIGDTFINLKSEYGSTIQVLSGSSLLVSNATFNITHRQKWACIYIGGSTALIADTTFADMKSKYATAIYNTNSTLAVNNCSFINLDANQTAGAIGIKDIEDVILIDNCRFINVSSVNNGGALFVDVNGMFGTKKGKVLINNTLFKDCGSLFGGSVLQIGGEMSIINSTFLDNLAIANGGAVYTSKTNLNVINSTFNNNLVPQAIEGSNQGGAIFFDNGELEIKNSHFEDNTALEGSDLYLYDSSYDISDSYFAGNISSNFEDVNSKLSNNTFLKDNKFNQTGYIYYYESNAAPIDYNPIYLDESLVNATSFDLRDYGLVSPVKNQGDMGSCWSFGVTGALESAYLKASNKTVLLDISETNIQNSGLNYSIFGIKDSQEGGLRTGGTAYMLSWLGVTTSSYNSYDELGKICPIYDNGTKYHIHNVVILPTRQNITDNQYFKEALVKYGAVGVSVHGAMKEDNFNEKTHAAYFYNETFGIGTDHTVTLVGWNDTFSKENFKTTPPGDGAWIIKNSWGSEWADK